MRARARAWWWWHGLPRRAQDNAVWEHALLHELGVQALPGPAAASGCSPASRIMGVRVGPYWRDALGGEGPPTPRAACVARLRERKDALTNMTRLAAGRRAWTAMRARRQSLKACLEVQHVLAAACLGALVFVGVLLVALKADGRLDGLSWYGVFGFPTAAASLLAADGLLMCTCVCCNRLHAHNEWSLFRFVTCRGLWYPLGQVRGMLVQACGRDSRAHVCARVI